MEPAYSIKTPAKQTQDGELKGLFVRPALSREMRGKAETKSVLEMIDHELKRFQSLPELDFMAGYLAGRIREKNMDGFITDAQAEQLTKVLYSKYELIRGLYRK